MGKKRHAPRDREKRFGDTAERSHCDACRKHNQDIHARREDGEAAHAEVTSVNILLHWVQESLIDKQQSENTELTAKHARSKRSLQSLETSAPHAVTDIIRGYRGDATRVRQHVARVITEQLERYSKEARRRDREPEKKAARQQNEEIHKHYVRDYKKRRRDRNSNMQPLTCSSSDTAIETVTNPQKDTSYSRRQRPHEGEIP